MQAQAMVPVGTFHSKDMQAGKISEFIARTLRTHVKPKCNSFAIVHDAEAGANIMTTRPVPPKLSEDELDTLAQTIAHEFYAEARQDVSTHSRSQRYLIIAYAGGDNVLCRWPIQLYPSVDKQLQTGGETEPANATGLLGHGMRHTEVAMRLALGHTNGLMERQDEEIDRLRKRCSELEDKNTRMLEAREALLSQQFERDLAYQREKRQDERLERLFLQVEKFVPMIAAKYGVAVPQLTAGTAAPDASTQPVEAFMHFYFTLSDKQKEGIIEILTEQQQGQFVKIIQGCMASIEKGKAA